jgi:hypothetical protein
MREAGRGLSRYEPWNRGRIGRVEHQVCRALIDAQYAKLEPVSTGWLLHKVYTGEWDNAAGSYSKIAAQHWMYFRIRRACEVYAVRVGRSEGRGAAVLWRIKDDVADYTVRREKTALYRRRKRSQRARARAIRPAQQANDC